MVKFNWFVDVLRQEEIEKFYSVRFNILYILIIKTQTKNGTLLQLLNCIFLYYI